MRAARSPREKSENKLMVVDSDGRALWEGRFVELGRHLGRGDLIVLNDAATLPASLSGVDDRGEKVEVRLASQIDGPIWRAVLFGRGDWRTPTEHRPDPPRLRVGESIHFEGGLDARVVRIDERARRLIDIEIERRGDALFTGIFSSGRPVQYAYLDRALELGELQTIYASAPWSMEMPSAGRPFTWALILELMDCGVRFASLTHAAGLSSTGDPELDRRLPFEERYFIPEETVLKVNATRAEGGRVIAVGTTVVRALEGCALLHRGSLVPGEGRTRLKIDRRHSPRIVSAILSGMHEPGSSHYRLLESLAPSDLLEEATRRAEAGGYLIHELGDSILIVKEGASRRYPGSTDGGHPARSASTTHEGARAAPTAARP
jgi:S-adenosylmethionine:tRNA ribosyltransferase-isomerase